jgi:hypothetical protein
MIINTDRWPNINTFGNYTKCDFECIPKVEVKRKPMEKLQAAIWACSGFEAKSWFKSSLISS